jgi:hypothetical protein
MPGNKLNETKLPFLSELTGWICSIMLVGCVYFLGDVGLAAPYHVKI